ncbi:MAG TPA: hypothetical protein VGA04_29850 [Streptosporangiaceae bacterium]
MTTSRTAVKPAKRSGLASGRLGTKPPTLRAGPDRLLAANSLHWLPELVLRRLYADLAGLIRAGGVARNADPMAPDGGERLIEALERHAHQMQPTLPEGELDWEGWWAARSAMDPADPQKRADRLPLPRPRRQDRY